MLYYTIINIQDFMPIQNFTWENAKKIVNENVVSKGLCVSKYRYTSSFSRDFHNEEYNFINIDKSKIPKNSGQLFLLKPI